MALFSSLSDKLKSITDRMQGKTRVTEKDIKEMMREIRLALLEADVHFKVVKELIDDISEKVKGADVMESLTPGQQVVKVVHEALIDIFGTENTKIEVSPDNFTVIMLYGLQGSGKTTTAAKLARLYKNNGKKPFLTSVDVHRPAAQEQLVVLAEQIDVPYHINPEEKSAPAIARRAVERAKYLMCDTLIVDTAGRMTVDPELMQELKEINQTVNPTERLLIVDAMIGQEAVNIALEFEEQIGIDGFIMTKLDGDARGGAALSIRHMTGKPIKMIATGEKLDALEEFHPERMASRILGMGDVLTLIEKATEAIDEKKAQEAYERMRKNQFTLDDMLDQFEQMNKMGGVQSILSMLPGMGNKISPDAIDDNKMARTAAIIKSMTPQERETPRVLNASRRKRIAAGSGVQVSDVNQLIKQYNEMQKMMKQFTRMGRGKQRRLMQQFGGGNLPF
ncbi:MAG: signal recognition particle protein [Clostridiaceae bacterium]|jgi:signal recognition particle subunit SRP54|nr:signal recognition particle protein [Bacillota bacterium]NLN52165.1 signal recognition particle protein [Clostridiaceae bacterium]